MNSYREHSPVILMFPRTTEPIGYIGIYERRFIIGLHGFGGQEVP